MYVKNLIPNFNSINDFVNHIGSYNEENIFFDVVSDNAILLQNKKEDNSLCFFIFRNKHILQPGKTYTISCEFELDSKITKTLPFDVPKIAFDGVKSNGEIQYDIKSSSSIPNEVGIWKKSLTVKIPNDFSSAWFRIHIGMEKGAGSIVVKNIFISETDFEFYPSNLFIQEGTSFLLKALNKKDRIELYTELSKYLKLNRKKLIDNIINSIDDIQLKDRLSIYRYLNQDDLHKVSELIYKLLEDLDELDEILVSDVYRLFAKKLEWEKLLKLTHDIDNTELYKNSTHILYEKAQLYRRVSDENKERECYIKALDLDKEKVNIDYTLFFDKYNPGLSYRRKELDFIVNNFEAIQKIANTYTPTNIDFQKTNVFVFWDQGYNQAPPIIQTMIDRMKNIYQDKLVILTSNNLSAYVDLSSGIEKFREKKRAFFSDYIRTELLLKYGGTWIDSTVFITERFNNEVNTILSSESSNLFVLRIPENPYRISSWFEATNQINNRIIALMYGALLIFAEQYDDIFEYYQYHTFFEILTQLDEKAKQDCVNNYKNNYQPHGHDLLKNFRNDWNEKLFHQLINQCPIQKLTYRSNLLHLRTQSFYKTILRNGKDL